MRQHQVAPCSALEVVKARQGDKGRIGKALSVLSDFHVRNGFIGFTNVDQKGHSHTWQIVFDAEAWGFHAGDKRLEVVGQNLLPPFGRHGPGLFKCS